MQVTQKNSTTREEVKNVRSINGLLDELGELTPNEANNLIKSNNCVVRKRAIEYADRQSRLKQLLAEDDSNVEELILSSLGDLTVEEANKLLLEAGDYNVREMAIKYADRQTKLARLLVEETSEVIDPILNSLGELTIEETDKLLKAHTLKVIKYAMLNVCSEGLEELRDVIIEKLKYIKE